MGPANGASWWARLHPPRPTLAEDACAPQQAGRGPKCIESEGNHHCLSSLSSCACVGDGGPDTTAIWQPPDLCWTYPIIINGDRQSSLKLQCRYIQVIDHVLHPSRLPHETVSIVG